MRAYCLSIHANYHCAHSGACCTAGWPIPVAPQQVSALRTRGLLPSDTTSLADRPDGQQGFLGKTADGACVFYDGARTRLCRIHRDAGPELMPVACRTFPRVALRDPRGVFVTLSHYCPTAARLLLSPGTIAIVEAPPWISLDGDVEGLDATGVMPPLLRAGMMMDLDGYSAWERAGIEVLSASEYSGGLALTVIAEATGDTSRWSPAGGPLATHVAAAFEHARSAHRHEELTVLPPFEHALKAFLASHLFASWEAYQPGSCLSAVVDRLWLAWSLIGGGHASQRTFIASARQTDLRLRHT